MPAIDHPLIDRFLESLWLEKGLSVHTRAAYRSDLALFNGWLQARDVQLADAGRELILDHLAWRLNEGYKARSTARLLSGLRGFYRFLLREQLISRDPTLQVELPQLGRPLPKSLSEADVEALLAAPELDDPIGLRDRAMLEVLYACGLRVSELIGLTLEQVNLRQGVLRVTGKGSKERLVPLGEESQHWLQRFWQRVPQQGHWAVFDRSWYGRVLVERIEGFCSPADWLRAYGEINDFEEQLADVRLAQSFPLQPCRPSAGRL